MSLENVEITGKVGFLTPKMTVLKFKLKIPIKTANLNEIDWEKTTQLKIDLDNLYISDELLEINLLRT